MNLFRMIWSRPINLTMFREFSQEEEFEKHWFSHSCCWQTDIDWLYLKVAKFPDLYFIWNVYDPKNPLQVRGMSYLSWRLPFCERQEIRLSMEKNLANFMLEPWFFYDRNKGICEIRIENTPCFTSMSDVEKVLNKVYNYGK